MVIQYASCFKGMEWLQKLSNISQIEFDEYGQAHKEENIIIEHRKKLINQSLLPKMLLKLSIPGIQRVGLFAYL